jgi:apolipoprotein N-acyltransferase
MSRSPLAAAALCALSGTAYGLAHRTGAWGLFAWVSLAPLFWVCGRMSPGRAFVWGWVFGAVAWAAGSPWLVDTAAKFLDLPRPAAWCAFAGFCLLEGSQFALAAGLSRWTAEGIRRRTGWPVSAALACAAPPVWVAVEWLFPEQFPKYLAVTQLFHLPTVQSAELFGTAGLAWLIVGFNAALYAAASDRRAWRALAAAALLAAANEAFGLVRIGQIDGQVAQRLAQGDAIRVGVAQGAEPIRDSRVRRPEGGLGAYGDLTAQAAAREPLDLVVWPEASFAGLVRCVGGADGLRAPRFNDRPLQAALRPSLPQKTHILLSVVAQAPSPAGLRTYNAAVLTGPQREFLGAALKRHLIPFGEFLPLADRFPFLRRFSPNSSDLTPGRGTAVLRMQDGSRLAVLICYEDMLPAYAREKVRQGADLLVHQSTDAWFSGCLPEMHLRFGSLRAVESRKFMVRAAQSGISAVVDPTGRVTRSLGAGVRGVITARVARMSGGTLYLLLGDALYAAAAALSLLLIALTFLARPARI